MTETANATGWFTPDGVPAANPAPDGMGGIGSTPPAEGPEWAAPSGRGTSAVGPAAATGAAAGAALEPSPWSRGGAESVVIALPLLPLPGSSLPGPMAGGPAVATDAAQPGHSTTPWPGPAAATEDLSRHPDDPDPVRSSKAVAVLVLGVAAVITGPLVGGIVPAVVAYLLAREASADLAAAQGFLSGARQIRTGLILAGIAVLLALAALVTASVIGIVQLVGGLGQDFPTTSD